MATESEPQTGAGIEYLYAFGRRIPKSQLARIPLDRESPLGSHGDQFDDDFWRWSHFRKPKLTGWLKTEKLSKLLQQQADEEYAVRQQRRPAAEIVAEEERKERIRELVLLASENDDPDTWRRVDELVAEA